MSLIDDTFESILNHADAADSMACDTDCGVYGMSRIRAHMAGIMDAIERYRMCIEERNYGVLESEALDDPTTE